VPDIRLNNERRRYCGEKTSLLTVSIISKERNIYRFTYENEEDVQRVVPAFEEILIFRLCTITVHFPDPRIVRSLLSESKGRIRTQHPVLDMVD